MKTKDQQGFLAPFVLILLYSVSSQVFSLAVLEQRRLSHISRRHRSAVEEEILWDQASLFIDTFLNAGADHPTPGVLEELPGYSHRTGSRFHYQAVSGVTVSLEELSSRLNPNFDSLVFWQRPPLSNRVTSPGALLGWDDERRNHGGNEDPEDFGELFPGTDWDCLYSLYSLPASHGEGGWNIHFMDPLMLEAVALYPWGGSGFNHPVRVFHRLSELQRNGPVTEEDLRDVFADEKPEARNALASRLGTRSWFWKICVFSDSGGIEIIIRYFHQILTNDPEGNPLGTPHRIRGFQMVSWKKTGRPG